MAKLTKQQTSEIREALYHLRRARRFIDLPDVAVARLTRHATTTLHFVKPNSDEALYPIDKGIGSDLTGLPDAERVLLRLLGEA